MRNAGCWMDKKLEGEVCGSKELEMTQGRKLIKSFLRGNWRGCRRRSVTASDGSLDAPAAMRLRKLRDSRTVSRHAHALPTSRLPFMSSEVPWRPFFLFPKCTVAGGGYQGRKGVKGERENEGVERGRRHHSLLSAPP